MSRLKDNQPGMRLIEGFEFTHGDRKFSCSVEQPWPTSKEAWWWFTVSADERHRYAPFQAAANDTRASVRARIIAYYEHLLARRAEPPTSYWRRGAPQNTAAAAQPNGAASQPNGAASANGAAGGNGAASSAVKPAANGGAKPAANGAKQAANGNTKQAANGKRNAAARTKQNRAGPKSSAASKQRKAAAKQL